MGMVDFDATGEKRTGYLALPSTESGPGVLVLHAWWGLNSFFQQFCDRLAQEGFVAFAPDLHLGQTASTIAEAEAIMDARDIPATETTALAGLDYLRRHKAVRSPQLGVIGFSMGVGWTLETDATVPDAYAAAVLFYGYAGADLSHSQTAFLAHFGEKDDWEPIEEVRKMRGDNLTLFTYPDAGHWFFESDRPDAYRPQDANLAWERTLEFLKAKLSDTAPA